MSPNRRTAGLAGILAGAGLAIEFALFMASGWTPETFADPASALAFLETGGPTLRAAAFAGLANLGFTIIFLVGLAAALRPATPNRAVAVLYLGLIGVAAHALVPSGLWSAPATFGELAADQPAAALGAWAGFAAFLDAAGGVGSVFAGAAITAAGSAILLIPRLPALLGWVGMVAGTGTLLSVLGQGTPIGAFTGAFYMPALLLLIAFRIWAGIELWRAPSRRPSPTTATASAGT